MNLPKYTYRNNFCAKIYSKNVFKCKCRTKKYIVKCYFLVSEREETKGNLIKLMLTFTKTCHRNFPHYRKKWGVNANISLSLYCDIAIYCWFILAFIFMVILWIGTRYFSKVAILLERSYRILQDEVEIHRKVQMKSTTYPRRKSC